MEKKELLANKLISAIIEKVHEDNLPVEIHTGRELKDGLTEVLFVYPETFERGLEPMIDSVFNETFGPLEGGDQ